MTDSPRRSFRRAVVTGGAGFLGSHLCEFLLGQGVEVVCLDNLITGRKANIEHLIPDPGFTFFECDVTGPLPAVGEIDLVLHFASPASPVDYLRLPIHTLKVGSIGTMNALELARDNDARFVLASTSEVYGDPLEHPQRESYWGNVNPVGPRGVYDEAKRFAEAMTTAHQRHSGMDIGIVRLFNSYGPRMRPEDGRAIPTFIRQALSNEPITVAGDGSQTRSICFFQDTVEGIFSLASSGHQEPVNIGNPEEISILDLAMSIRDMAGSRSSICFIDRPVDDPRVRRPDITLARDLLKWEPRVPSVEGLQQTIEWFADQLDVQHQPPESAFPVPSQP